jgi:metallo-beta-lactamase class B
MTTQGDIFCAQADASPAQGDISTAQGDTKSHKVTRDSRKATNSSPGPSNTWSMSYIAARVRPRPHAILARIWLALLAPLVLAGCATIAPAPQPAEAGPGQRAWAAACADNDSWDKPGPPFRIYGRSYYVGTCGISAVLVVGPEGHTLIDSGTDKGADIVLANIRALGFDPKDVKTLLLSHEHFDHVGGMARLQAATGATIVTTEAAAKVLRSGVTDPADPQAKSGHPPFPSVTGKIVTLDGPGAVLLGDWTFRAIRTPGHTLGAMSWSWQDCEDTACKSIVYADSLNPISSDGYRFSDHPDLVAGFRAGIAEIGAAPCDIVLAPHPGAVSLRARLAGDKPLIDRDGCRAYAAGVTERLDKRLAVEAKGG